LGFDILNDLIKSTKNWNLLVLLEFEFLIFPGRLDNAELLFNLVFLLGSVNKFSNLFSILVKLKLDEVFEAELW